VKGRVRKEATGANWVDENKNVKVRSFGESSIFLN
jgi:hypothetical protein